MLRVIEQKRNKLLPEEVKAIEVWCHTAYSEISIIATVLNGLAVPIWDVHTGELKFALTKSGLSCASDYTKKVYREKGYIDPLSYSDLIIFLRRASNAKKSK